MSGLWSICIFVCRIYTRAWTEAPITAASPRNNLALVKDLLAYADVNNAVTRATLTRFLDHLWYLSEELVALALFDPAVSIDEKRKIVGSLHDLVGQDSDMCQDPKHLFL